MKVGDIVEFRCPDVFMEDKFESMIKFEKVKGFSRMSD